MSAIKDKACPENPSGQEDNSSQSETDSLFEWKALLRSARPSLSRLVIGVECEEIRDGLSEPARHSFKFLERRCVSSALDQTQEIDGDANQFRKFLLCFGRFITNLADAKPELFLYIA